MIRVSALGQLDLRRSDGTELNSVLAQPKRTALLVHLATSQAGFCQRDTLLGRFWPDSTMERARHSLNQALYALRRSLGEGVIASCGDDAVSIDRSLLWCDAFEFELALADDRLSDALELYRGELLEGFFLSAAPEFENWVELERGRLRERALAAAWSLAERDESAGNEAGAASWARRAALLAPDDENGLRRLLGLLDRVGDRAGAVAAYDAFVRRLATEHGAAPTDATVELGIRIRGPAVTPADADPPARSTPAPLPVPLTRATPLIGRIEERDRVIELLTQSDARLVTLTGPGGIGTTRLAMEVATQAASHFADGVCVVPLAGIDAVELVPEALAQALGLPASPVEPLEQIERWLARRATLLVLDDCEHLLDMAPLLAALLERAPRLRMLVTSREPLSLRAEWVVPLTGLTVPPLHAARIEEFDAVRLFIATARRVNAGFEIDDVARPHVTRICQIAEGIPLALELAAAWTRALTCEDVCREIERSLRFLAGSMRDVPERHRSLWAACEHSWRLLEEPQRAALSRLAVFRGEFTRDAAENVAGATIDTLLALVDKSLVRCTAAGRYSLLRTLREFAEEKLAEDERVHADARERHARYYIEQLVTLSAEPSGPGRDECLARIARDIENVRAAWHNAIRTGDIAALDRGARPLFIFFDCHGWVRGAATAFGEAARSIDATATSDDTARGLVLGVLLARQGCACARLGRAAEAESLLERALALARAANNAGEAAFALDRLGVLAYERGKFAAAQRLQQEGLELRRASGDASGLATSLNNLGSLAYALGDYENARQHCEGCLELQQRLGDATGEAISLQNLGFIAFARGDYTTSQDMLHRALAVTRRLGSRMLIARALLNLGNLSTALQRADDAHSYMEASLGIALESGAEPVMLEVMVGLAGTCRAQRRPDVALEIAALVLHRDMAEERSRAAAAALVAELDAEMPADIAHAAVERGRAAALAVAVEDSARVILRDGSLAAFKPV
jgi:predicted ATPase/DNA-binding SARP family transcriptional activator/Tfp pilus assembly protein PilF